MVEKLAKEDYIHQETVQLAALGEVEVVHASRGIPVDTVVNTGLHYLNSILSILGHSLLLIMSLNF